MPTPGAVAQQHEGRTHLGRAPVGDPDQRRLEDGRVLDEDALDLLTEAELVDFCRERLARFKVPAYVRVVKDKDVPWVEGARQQRAVPSAGTALGGAAASGSPRPR